MVESRKIKGEDLWVFFFEFPLKPISESIRPQKFIARDKLVAQRALKTLN